MPCHRHLLLLVSVFVASAAVAASCGDDDSAAPVTSSTSSSSPVAADPTDSSTTMPATTTVAPDPRGGRPFAVTTRQLTLVDSSRSTPESEDGPESDGRTLEVWLTLPARDDPAPLIVFSHGMAGHPRKFEDLHAVWAEAGYAVAAPAFPLSNDTAAGAFTNGFDVPNQPGDVSFLLDELLARSEDGSSDLAGRFDPERLGAAGLSAGGFTTYEVAVNELARDDRFSAAVVMAGSFGDEPGSFVAAEGLPVLVMQGDADPLIEVATAERAYAALGAPRYLVVLHEGGHAGPFEDLEDAFEVKVPGHDALIAASTVAFWDRYLLDIEAAGEELLAAAAEDGLTTLEADVG